ncbi:MAG TPA: hypothetical protein DIS96_06125, partial [Pusillimonas sp.]|nr:hypothetical protein [Pusillimonas sp.]
MCRIDKQSNRRRFPVNLACAALVTYSSMLVVLPAYAQTGITLDPVVVTATRLETEILDTPASVSIVDGNDLRL